MISRNSDLDSYRIAVSAEMLRRYAIAWIDACGDDEPLIRGRETGETPAEFVARWGDKYDLGVVSDLDVRYL